MNEWLDIPDEQFDFSGDNDTVSKFAPENGSVTFSDTVDEHSYNNEAPANPSVKLKEKESTNVSLLTENSQELRIMKIEKENQQIRTDISTILNILQKKS